MRTKVFAFCLAVLSTLLANAQSAQFIGAANGLRNPCVYAIEQDAFGFVWVGTRDGLYIYNEGKAVEFNLQNEAIRTRNIQSLCFQQDSSMAVGLQDGSLLWINTANRTVDTNRTAKSFGAPVLSIYEDSHQNIWLATEGQGIWVLWKGSETWELLQHSGKAVSLFAFDFLELGSKLWIGASGNGLLYYDYQGAGLHFHAAWMWELSAYRKSLTNIGDTLVAGLNSGIFGIYKDSVWRFDAPTVNVRDISSAHGMLWVTTDGNGLYYQARDGKWNHISKHHPGAESVTDQYYAVEHIQDRLWVGSFNGGVSVFEPQKRGFINLGVAPRHSVLSLAKAEDALWVGCDGDGLFKCTLEGSEWKASMPWNAKDLTGSGVVASLLHHPGTGNIWVGLFEGGLIELDQDGVEVSRYYPYEGNPWNLKYNSIWSMAHARGDSLWIGGLGGLQLWTGEVFVDLHQNPLAFGRNIMAIEPNGLGAYVGTEFQGVYALDNALNVTHIPIAHAVLSLKAVGDHLYIGTEGGGAFLYTPSGGLDTLLPASEFWSVYSIDTLDQRVYLFTGHGIMQLPVGESAQPIELADNASVNIAQFNRGAVVGSNGQLVLGTTDGAIQIRPTEVERKPEEPILFTGLVADDQYVSTELLWNALDTTYVLPPGTRTVKMEFEYISADAAEPRRSQYRVVGEESEWLDLGEHSRAVVMGHLRPKTYEVALRSVGPQGEELNVLNFSFKVLPYWYQTWWFIALVAMIFVVAAVVVVRFLQQRKLRQTRLKLLQTERELLHAQARELKMESKARGEQLSFQLLKSSSRIEMLERFAEQLKTLQKKLINDEAKQEIKQVQRNLRNQLQSESYWEDFERNYTEVHAEFSKKLTAKFPSLTKSEVRMAYLINEELSNKEMANVLHVSAAAIEKSKYRLKKKLDLSKDQDLTGFVRSLSSQE